MASLTGNEIRNTYQSLLKASDNGVIDATEKTITDGFGNASTLSMGTSSASFSGTLNVTNADVQGLDGLVPAGGLTDQVLTKVDGTDYNYQWSDAAGGTSTIENLAYLPTFSTGLSGYAADSYYTASQPLIGDITWQNAIDLNSDRTLFGILNVYPGQPMNTVAIPVTAPTANSTLTLNIWDSHSHGTNSPGYPANSVHTETIAVPASATDIWVVHNFVTTFTPGTGERYWFSLTSPEFGVNFNLKNTVFRATIASTTVTIFGTTGAPGSALGIGQLQYTGVLPSSFLPGASFSHRDEGAILLYK